MFGNYLPKQFLVIQLIYNLNSQQLLTLNKSLGIQIDYVLHVMLHFTYCSCLLMFKI